MPCIDENIALQFVQGLLGEEQAREVERHAAGCAECRWLLAAAGGGNTGETLTVADGPSGATPLAALDRVLAGDYRLERLIGSGGMGTVYEASHARLPRRYAVKLLVQGQDADSEAVARLRREAEITSRLSHPHIVEAVDFNTTEQGIPFVVMELLKGESLAALLRRERVVRTVEQLAAIVRQTTSALGAAHAKGVIHRDLKPNNIFLCRTEGGQVCLKVMDFGISKVMGSTTELTGDMTVLGSPGYMAPEQARGESSEVDWRADIFSMGAIIYRMLVGRTPFAADTVPATLYKVVHENPAEPPGWRRVPRPLQQVILRALSKKPTARQRSMEQLWSEFREALALCGYGDQADLEEPETPSPQRQTYLTDLLVPPPRRRWWLLGVALGTLALGLGAVVGYISSSPPARIAAVDDAASPRADTARQVAGPTDAASSRDAAPRTNAPPRADAASRAHAPSRAVARPRHRPRRRHGRLTVQSKSEDGRYLWAEVYVDGRRIGRTPIMRRRLPAGPHRVELRRGGYRTVAREVTLRPGAREVMSLVLVPEPAPDQ